MLVGEGHLDHGHVAGQHAAAVEPLGLAQEDGDVVGVSGLYVLAYIAAYEECLMEEDSLILGIGVGSGSLGVEVVDPRSPASPLRQRASMSTLGAAATLLK